MMRNAHWIGIVRKLSASQRLAAAAVLGGVSFALLPEQMRWANRLAISWDLGVVLNLALAWILVAGTDSRVTREMTERQDQSSRLLLVFVVVASCASIGGIMVLMGSTKDGGTAHHLERVALAVITIALSWAWIHTRFGFHYAHRYYLLNRPSATPRKVSRGLLFPGDDAPDFLDFMYFAFTIGMASQVSDVAVTSRAMRRLTLIHAITSFAFNLSIIALAINLLSAAI